MLRSILTKVPLLAALGLATTGCCLTSSLNPPTKNLSPTVPHPVVTESEPRSAWEQDQVERWTFNPGGVFCPDGATSSQHQDAPDAPVVTSALECD